MTYELENAIKKKFIKDSKLPIPVFEKGYFEYFLNLYEDFLGSRTKFNEYLEVINEVGFDKYNEGYRKLLDNIIKHVTSKESYKKFLEADMSFDRSILEKINKKKSLYTEVNSGKSFISVDMKTANFKSLSTFDIDIVDNFDNYADWICSFENGQLYKDYKALRQVLFGNLNPKRQQQIQSSYMFKLLSLYDELYGIQGMEVILLGADEIVFEYSEETLNNLKNIVDLFVKDKSHKFEFVLEVFKLEKLTKYKEFGYVKYHFDGKEELVGTSKNFYAQAYKELKGLPLEEADFLFYYEGVLSKMLFKLEDKKGEDENEDV